MSDNPLSPEGLDQDLRLSHQRLNTFESNVNKLMGYFEGPDGLWTKIAALEERTATIQRMDSNLAELTKSMAEIKGGSKTLRWAVPIMIVLALAAISGAVSLVTWAVVR